MTRRKGQFFRRNTMLFHQKFGPVHMIAKVFTSHVAVNSGTPVAAITRASPVVDVKNGIPVINQQVVEHILPEIAAPPLMGILQVSGTMHKDHRRPVGCGISGRKSLACTVAPSSAAKVTYSGILHG
jgi:hypothetical protein